MLFHLWVGVFLPFKKTLGGNSDGLSKVIAIPEEGRQPISMGKQRGHNPGIEQNAPLATEMKKGWDKMETQARRRNYRPADEQPGHSIAGTFQPIQMIIAPWKGGYRNF